MTEESPETRRCPNYGEGCSRVVRPEWSYCPGCGVRLSSTD